MDFLSLRIWFQNHKRDLPWRRDTHPYRVWVSEVMLQQTQVQTVIPYFKHWMEKFPSLKHLSQAKEEEVLKCWEGLGYYSRARNLHQGAKFILTHYKGSIPSTMKELLEIKGIGNYTAAAILSFSFFQKVSVIDGNVLRVLSRLFLITDEITSSKTQRELREKLQDLLPNFKPWVVSEALIELGAILCRPHDPKCTQCPLSSQCKAFLTQQVDLVPKRKKKEPIQNLFRTVGLIYYQNCWLVRQNPTQKILGKLWEFPYHELEDPYPNKEVDLSYFENKYSLALNYQFSLSPVTHRFTQFHVTLFPMLYKIDAIDAFESFSSENKSYHWLSPLDLNKLVFCAGHRKLRNTIHKKAIML
jgi:A/G-specific adenine glycosylase